jgi:hypothetical protein
MLEILLMRCLDNSAGRVSGCGNGREFGGKCFFGLRAVAIGTFIAMAALDNSGLNVCVLVQ